MAAPDIVSTAVNERLSEQRGMMVVVCCPVSQQRWNHSELYDLLESVTALGTLSIARTSCF